MTDKDMIDWINWYVQGDASIEFEEEDGGLVLWVKEDKFRKKVSSFVGGNVREVLAEAAKEFPMPLENTSQP